MGSTECHVLVDTLKMFLNVNSAPAGVQQRLLDHVHPAESFSSGHGLITGSPSDHRRTYVPRPVAPGSELMSGVITAPHHGDPEIRRHLLTEHTFKSICVNLCMF